MRRFRVHHRPTVRRATKVAHLSRWWAWCDGCGWARPADEWHTAYIAALDHAETRLT